MTITFDVVGLPAPKGSKTAFVRGGRAVLVDGGPSKTSRDRYLAWKRAVEEACVLGVYSNVGTATTATLDLGLLDGPLAATFIFRLPRPKRETRVEQERIWHATTPDGDKLARAAADPLIGRVIADDARIARWVVEKRYVCEGEQVGCTITIATLAQTE